MTRCLPLLVATVASIAWSQVHSAPAVRDVTYEEAAPAIDAAGPDAPAEITRLAPAERPPAWRRWVERRRAAVTSRIQRGEEDSLVPLLLFGTSFTRAPRITREFLQRSTQASDATSVVRAMSAAFAQRVDDLLRAMQDPRGNERHAWARATLERLRHRLDTPEGRAKAGTYLVENFARVTRESGELAALLRADAGSPAPAADRARVFASRGLAPDTSWPIDFALREALAALASSGTVGRGSVARVAIIGPGLDFVDKDEGHDYYPPQTLQPFAVVDALAALGLADAESIQVTTLDVSDRVNGHIRGLPARSSPYDLQLVRSSAVRWSEGATRFFATFGSRVGQNVAPIGAPAGFDARAVRVAPALLRRIRPVELDVVYQRLPLEAAQRFDVVVATNVLVYYDRFEQALAARGIEAMLRPGGVLLANTPLDDAPGFAWREVQRTTHVFSDRPGDGEILMAYARRADSR